MVNKDVLTDVLDVG